MYNRQGQIMTLITLGVQRRISFNSLPQTKHDCPVCELVYKAQSKINYLKAQGLSDNSSEVQKLTNFVNKYKIKKSEGLL